MVRQSKSNRASGKVPARPSGVAGAVQHFVEELPSGARIWVAFSGGLDSHVLLHLCQVACTARADITLQVIHVNHNLQCGSADWAAHCTHICESLSLPLEVCEVDVVDGGQGLEAAARRVRYEQFARVMQRGDFLLLGQHADDQAETFLLQALRGSGPDGLAAIPRRRSLASGTLCRPLLACTRAELEQYAHHHALDHIVDPSNTDTRFDRNFLRQQIMPRLRERWPSAARTLSRSAARSGAASQLLLTLANSDLQQVRILECNELDISRLLELRQERLFNVLRLWVRQSGYQLPKLQDLQEVNQHLLHNRAQTGGLVKTSEYEFRRFRNRLYLLPPRRSQLAEYSYPWQLPYQDLYISEIGITLSEQGCVAQGLNLPLDLSVPVQVQNRKGGELIRLGHESMHKSVKKLLQEADIPPWQRDEVPLVYVNGELAAVWNVAVAADFRL